MQDVFEGEQWQQILSKIQTWDEAKSVGIDLSQQQSSAGWALGDLANKVAQIRSNDPLMEQKAVTLKVFAREIRVGYSLLKEAARVSRAIEPGMRSPALTFTHHRVLVRRGLAGSEMIEWQRKAEQEEWTADELDRAIRDDQASHVDESSPVEWKKARRWLTTTARKADELFDDIVVQGVENNPDGVVDELARIRCVLKMFEDALATLTKQQEAISDPEQYSPTDAVSA